MRFVRHFAVTAVVVLVCVAHHHHVMAAEVSTASVLNTKVDAFTLKDYRGKTHSLDDFSDAKAVVIAFLGTECPLVKLYGTRLQELQTKYSGKLSVIGINSNKHDSVTEIAAFARRHALTFPILKDVGNKFADQLNAKRTPEVYLLDQKRNVRYFGRIDDQYGVGYIKEEPTTNDLEDAIEQILAGDPVTIKHEPSVGCLIGRIKQADPNSNITYSNQIARILQKRCVECHRAGEIAPFELTEYSEVSGWAEMIREVVQENRMPPWHADPKHGEFLNDRRLTDEERQTIFKWVDAGAPEGDPNELPKPMEYTQDWQLSRKPDLVVKMRDTPFKVQAEGVVRYQYFTVDPGFTEDKWVTAAEIIPGNRAVVHHVLVFARSGRRDRGSVAGGGAFLAGYVPGQRAHAFPKGMAKMIPAGSKLIFQVHYTPIGTKQEDVSSIGFLFADPKEIDHVVMTHETRPRRLRIPAGEENVKVEATSTAAPTDVKLLGLMPHMHVRGKAFKYELVPPKGEPTTILDVPEYDFNWQTSYRLKEPLDIAANTKIHCIAHYNNSSSNLNNPNPNKNVGWGDQTTDEMMIGYIDIAIPREDSDASASTDNQSQVVVKLLMKRYDKNGDGKIVRSEVTGRESRVFDRLDVNKDDIVTMEELQKLKR